MFSNRRPLPSARTMRLLYQLGYICTGTAAGLATLCLEEQRRRIQILQRVADNAKVIRQHPRYRGGAGAAAVGEWGREKERDVGVADGGLERGVEGMVYEPVMFGGWEILEKRDWDRVGRRGKERTAGRMGIQELGEADGTPRRRGERRELYGPSRASRGPKSSAQQTRRTESARNSHEMPEKAMRPRPVERIQDVSEAPPPRLPHTASAPKQSTPDANGSPRVHAPGQSKSARKKLVFDPYRTLKTSRGKKLSYAHAINRLNERDAQRKLSASISTTEKNLDHAPGSSLGEIDLDFSAEDLTHDIQLFLRTTDDTASMKADPRIATHLIRSALIIGSVEEIRSLVDWKLSHNNLAELDVRELCASCGMLGRRVDRKKVYDLYTAVLVSEAFLAFDSTFRLEQAIAVMRNGLELNNGSWPIDPRILFRRSLSQEDYDTLVTVLRYNCRELLLRGDLDIAKRLPRLMKGRVTPEFKERLAGCLDGFFDAAIAGREFEECKNILLWKWSCFGYKSLTIQLGYFVKACGEAKEDGVLVDLINSETGLRIPTSTPASEIDNESRRAILQAFVRQGMTHGTRFEHLLSSLPEQDCAPFQALRAVFTLRELWMATHNFEEIEGRVQALHKELTDNGDNDTLARLDEVAIQIYVQADKLNRALAMIAHMHNTTRASNFAICQTALALAKKGDWPSFNHLVDIMKKMESFRFDGDAPKASNAVIWTYSLKHDAKETWDFVAAAMRDLGFRPTRATHSIILESFVSQNRFDLIPRWMDFVEEQGHSVHVGAKLATALLRTYYVKHRPSHVLMMWLCRKLIAVCPSLASENLVQLVQQAIGYDLRHISGQHGSWQQVHAEIRLSRLHAENFIPSPGFAWNGELMFHDSHRVVPDLEPTTVHSEEPSATITSSDRPSATVDRIDYRDPKATEAALWRYMSLDQHAEVLRLYHQALNAKGAFTSPVLLEIAVQASLQLHNSNDTHASQMLSRARELGVNTSQAAALIIMHRAKASPPQSFMHAQHLCRLVHEQYRLNDEASWRVSHHLATSIAHTLITNGFAEMGLDLHSSIYTSQWTTQTPFDDAAMTVFLKGYIAVQSLAGIRWVVSTMLDRNIRITKVFMRQLRFITRGNFKWMSQHASHVHPLLTSLVQRCSEARKSQLLETHLLGWKLVNHIAKATKEGADIDIDATDFMETRRITLEMEESDDSVPDAEHATLHTVDAAAPNEEKRDLAGEAGEYNDSVTDNGNATSPFVDESYFSDETEMKKRMDEDRKAEQEFRQRMRALARRNVERGQRFAPLLSNDEVEPSTESSKEEGGGMSSYRPII